MLRIAHDVRVGTDNKYDIIDVLEMHPYRRRLLVASLLLESEEQPKPDGK
ncbi:hypothetical protein [Pseudobacillus badius]|nr:hypothetical protein [Bacillus badius]GLY11421.1 hypothetical protein Bbad01_26370 [Bacillus badius]